MDAVLEYIVTMLPTLIALIAECGVVKYAMSMLQKAKETKEFKEVMSQNKKLLNELRESKRLNQELLTKIDRIKRNVDENGVDDI